MITNKFLESLNLEFKKPEGFEVIETAKDAARVFLRSNDEKDVNELLVKVAKAALDKFATEINAYGYGYTYDKKTGERKRVF